jgi:glycosyltransferase involved in cell wall biosynthesis
MQTTIKNIAATASNPVVKKRIAIVTCCNDAWGGSEDLWWGAAVHLRNEGFDVMILKSTIDYSHPKFRTLSERGVSLKELDVLPKKSQTQRFLIKAWKKFSRPEQDYLKIVFENHLRNFQPDHVLISQGINFDGLTYADSCMELNLPFSLISQKAVEFYWPQPHEREVMAKAFRQAKQCFFVSRHNQQLTEEQFGFRFENAQIICNPLKTKKGIIPYPSTSNGFKLACVGRLFLIDKGQDILLRVLAQPKWKQRAVTVSFIGKGVDETGLKELAALLQVINIEFKGHIEDIKDVWREHHALVLPSRSEGLPLVILEAMALGRMVIATTAGGNAELLEEGRTGFLAEATFSSVDAALEKAWQFKSEWEEMGRNAFEYICNRIPEAPETKLAKTLTKLIYEP